MAKRSTDWMTVRGIVGVTRVPAIGGLPGLWSRSYDIVIREQGNRKLRLRMTKKNAKALGVLLSMAVL